jgi:hypothetical protein
MHGVVIAVHVIAGSLGLLLAGPVLFAPKRPGWHTVLGRTYAVAAVALCLSAFWMVAGEPRRLFGLGILGVLTLCWVAAGVWIARYKPRLSGPGAWRIWHLNLMSSSVISFVTAFAVQVADGHWLAWILPTVVGSPLIARRTAREVAARPRRAAPQALRA